MDFLRSLGSGHGGCQANCLIFWKEDWLKAPGSASSPASSRSGGNKLLEAARTPPSDPRGDVIYRCQATQLLEATDPLPPGGLGQYLTDIRSGNVTLLKLLRTFAFALFHRVVRFGFGYRVLVSTYNGFQKLFGGSPYPFAQGTRSTQAVTPLAALDLQPGELVRIRSHDEILATLNAQNKNRGLYFDAEMVPYCGGVHRVLHRVERIIDERSGRMLKMKAPCIMLEDVVCKSAYSPGRLLCPRAIQSYWRESWLERVPEADAADRLHDR